MNAFQLAGRKKKNKRCSIEGPAQEAQTLINIPLKHGTDATPLTTNVFIYQSISHKSLFRRPLSPLAGKELLEKVGESENNVHLLGLIISPSHLLLYFPPCSHPRPAPTVRTVSVLCSDPSVSCSPESSLDPSGGCSAVKRRSPRPQSAPASLGIARLSPLSSLRSCPPPPSRLVSPLVVSSACPPRRLSSPASSDAMKFPPWPVKF